MRGVLLAATLASATALALGVDRVRSTARPAPADGSATADALQDYNAPYDGRYHFMRIRYGGGEGGFGRRGREPMWAHDYPRGERNFLKILDEVTGVRAQVDGSNVYTLDDPEIFRFPVAYIVEVGFWDPTDEEIERLGEYLLKGGFLIVDDFRDEWAGRTPALDNLEYQLKRAIPGAEMILVEDADAIFDSFFRIVPAQVIPPYGPRNATWYGVYEDNDRTKRLMAIINYNNDISEYWEFSDRGYYSIDLSNEAYKLGVNYVVYALTH